MSDTRDTAALRTQVGDRLRGLAYIADRLDPNDGVQLADKAWILATINDVCDLFDTLQPKSDIVPLYDADLNPINR